MLLNASQLFFLLVILCFQGLCKIIILHYRRFL